MTLKFKVDENLPGETCDILHGAGHQAETVVEEGLGGSEDAIVAARIREEGRVLLTLDLDFSNMLAYPPSDYDGLVILRPGSQAKPQVLQIVRSLIPLFQDTPIQGRLWIADEQGIRLRGE